MLPVFEEVLSPYPTEKIIYAFKEWLKTESRMPAPADILKIVKGEHVPEKFTRPEHKPFPDELESEWKKMNEEERRQFNAMMDKWFGGNRSESQVTTRGEQA